MMRVTGRAVGLLLVMASAVSASGSLQDANSVLGFENASDWTIQTGTILGTTSVRTQGAAALAVHASGYTVLKSRLIGPLGQVFQTLSFDLGLPGSAPGAWAGDCQLFVSIPSQGVNNSFIGQVALTGLKRGQYNRIHFQVPDALLAKMRSSYSDLTFSIALNVPNNTQDQYLLDNFEVSSTIPPNGTVGLSDRIAILGFETQSPPWTMTSGTVSGLSVVQVSQGDFSLGIQPRAYSVLTSPPLPTIGPVGAAISFDLWQPQQTPAPTFATAQLFVSIPSQGVNSAYLGQSDLTKLPNGQFSTIAFPVPANLVASLNAPYTDLRFSVAFNVPSTSNTVYYIDNFQTGSLTVPPALLPEVAAPADLVGRATSGVITFSADGSSASPSLTDALFQVEESDKSCSPTAAQACRYLVRVARFTAGPFVFQGTPVAGAQVSNVTPFEVVMGGNGASSLSSVIPSNVVFSLRTTSPNKSFLLLPGAYSSISISPSGAGLLAAAAQFQGTVAGHALSVNFSATANSPLANRPPVASAGPDQTIVTNNCYTQVTLDASGSSDPDGNIRHIAWYDGPILVGRGVQPKVWILDNGTGVHVMTAVVEDSFGSESRDQMIVNATFLNECVIRPDPTPVIK